MGNEIINKVEPKKEVEKKPKPTKKLADQNLIWLDEESTVKKIYFIKV